MTQQLTAALTLDTTQLRLHWQNARDLLGQIQPKAGVLVGSFDTLTVTAAPGVNGVVTFTVNDAQLQANIDAIRDLLASAVVELDSMKIASPTLVVTQVT